LSIVLNRDDDSMMSQSARRMAFKGIPNIMIGNRNSVLRTELQYLWQNFLYQTLLKERNKNKFGIGTDMKHNYCKIWLQMNEILLLHYFTSNLEDIRAQWEIQILFSGILYFCR
jgi:hypothetical protein